MWGNTASSGAQIYDDGATPDVSYSDVQGGGYAGAGNIDADPLFVAPVAASDRADDNGRLPPAAPLARS